MRADCPASYLLLTGITTVPIGIRYRVPYYLHTMRIAKMKREWTLILLRLVP
jgi:hypothetical protein